MALSVITPAAVLPVTVSEVGAQVRADLAAESSLVTLYIEAVTAKAEAILKRSLITQTLAVTLDEFPLTIDGPIALPMAPVQTISSVKYLDGDGVRQTLNSASYQFVNDNTFPRVIPAYDQTWPSCRVVPGSVVVEYVAGYGLAVAVPGAIKAWIMLNVANLYENRETVVIAPNVSNLDTMADGLLDGYRVVSF